MPHQYRGSRCRVGAGPPQACHPGGENRPELGRQAGRLLFLPSVPEMGQLGKSNRRVQSLGTPRLPASFIPATPTALARPQHLPTRALKLLYPPQKHPTDPLPERTDPQGLWESDKRSEQCKLQSVLQRFNTQTLWFQGLATRYKATLL